MSNYQEIMEECFKKMHEKSQQAIIRQIEFHQWYKRTFKRILDEKGVVTPEDMEKAFINGDN